MEAEFLSTKECLAKIRQHGSTAQDMLRGLLTNNTLDILEVIQASECINVTEIEHQFDDVAQSYVSIGLRHLRQAGLVDRERINKFKYYHIVPGSIERLNRICAELADGYDASVTAMDLVESN